MIYLVTGTAGFIGFHTAKALLESGATVIGVDNFSDYYDVSLKEARNAVLKNFPGYKLLRGDLADLGFVRTIFAEHKIDKICHLAAQAGVRYSLKNPHAYVSANLTGFTNLIDEAKNAGVKHFIYASSSSVYGDQEKMPLSEDFVADKPLSLYAATKKSNELIAYTYHHLYGMQCTGLRFFTVYGPYSRPDMAMFIFTKAILDGKPIQVFNDGKMRRDFTYVGDIVDGIMRSLERSHPYEIINLGNHHPVELGYMIETLEKALGKSAIKEYLPIQPGDVVETYADISHAREALGWEPKTGIEEGIGTFVEWYRTYYKI
jgi:UDP-glucuronate 4-epimerase